VNRPITRETVHVATPDGNLIAYSVRPAAGFALGTALFLHGKTFASVPDFDLQVPGADHTYSFMEYLASRGVHCWSFDHRGFGGSWKPQAGALFTARVRALDARQILYALRARMPKPLTLVGLSLGCAVVASLFDSQADIADAAILLGPARWQSFATLKGYWKAFQLALLSGGNKSAYITVKKKSLEDRLYAGEEAYMQRATLEAFVDGAITANPDGPKDAVVALVSEVTPYISRPRINVPVLAIRGSSDTIATAEDMDAVRRFIRPELLTERTFPNRKHDLHLYNEREDVFSTMFEFIAVRSKHPARATAAEDSTTAASPA
jgi:alpha-beta hydrolase superfamily lysophospholipase